MAHEGTTLICFASTRMNSDYSTGLIDSVLVSPEEMKEGEKVLKNFILFSNTTMLLFANKKKTKEFLMSQNILLFWWTAHSLELNLIENLWSLLSVKVFQHGHQYYAVQELSTLITQGRSNTDQTTIQNLINSISHRLKAIIKNKGHKKY